MLASLAPMPNDNARPSMVRPSDAMLACVHRLQYHCSTNVDRPLRFCGNETVAMPQACKHQPLPWRESDQALKQQFHGHATLLDFMMQNTAS